MWGLLAVIGARALVSWAGEVAAFRAAGQVKQTLRERLFAHLLTLGPAYLRRERSGELVQTAIDGIEALKPTSVNIFPNWRWRRWCRSPLPPCCCPPTFCRLSLLLTAPLIPLFMVLIGKAAEGLTRRQWKQLSLMGAHFLDVLQGLATLKALGRSGRQAETIERVSDEFRQVTLARCASPSSGVRAGAGRHVEHRHCRGRGRPAPVVWPPGTRAGALHPGAGPRLHLPRGCSAPVSTPACRALRRHSASSRARRRRPSRRRPPPRRHRRFRAGGHPLRRRAVSL